MTFLNPIAFWGLLSLLIPLIIHLLSKKQKNKIYFGSNRFLSDQETTSASSIQLTDYKLLFIRLLLLGTLIAALAGLSQIDTKINKTIYIENDLRADDDYAAVLEEVNPKAAKIYFSYNQMNKDEGITYFPSAFTLLHQLNQSKDSIKVYTHSLEKHFLGNKIAPNKNIDWKIIPKKEVATSTTIDGKPLSIEIINAQKSENHKSDIENVISSLAAYLPFKINYTSDAEWQILIDTLSEGNVDNTIYWDTNSPIFSFEKNFNAYSLKGAMNKKAFLASNFPLEITQALINARSSTNKEDSKTYDPRTTITENVVETIKAESPKNYLSRSNYLWLLVMALILLERYYSLRIASK